MMTEGEPLRKAVEAGRSRLVMLLVSSTINAKKAARR